MPLFSTTLTAIYYAVCALLTVLGIYRITLLWAWWRTQGEAESLPAPLDDSDLPPVTVQLPLFNERFVARRLLESVAALDWPRDRLQIQILDDSTDRTAVLTRRLAQRLRRRGLDVLYLHRPRRDGYKAGALAAGLTRATGTCIAILDADFVPAADFLRRTIPSLLQPGVGVVQARWGHLNRDASWFTRLQAILLDGHFAIEQPARSRNGWLLTFNGTAGVWRRDAIETSGGWRSDTLTEDLDLSMRAQLAGWRIVYLDRVVVPAELPEDSDSFRSQQRRWTKGGVQVARKMLPRIWRAPLPWSVKVEATLHLGCYAAYPLLITLALLRTPVRLLATQSSWLGLLPGEVTLLALGTLPLAFFYCRAQRAAGGWNGSRRAILDAFAAMALGAGLAVGNAVAVLEGLFGRGVQFERTPKRGGVQVRAVTHGDPTARPPAFYHVAGVRIATLEMALLVYLVTCKVFWAGRSLAGELPFLSFFTFGLLAMAGPSLRSAWRASRTLRPAAVSCRTL